MTLACILRFLGCSFAFSNSLNKTSSTSVFLHPAYPQALRRWQRRRPQSRAQSWQIPPLSPPTSPPSLLHMNNEKEQTTDPSLCLRNKRIIQARGRGTPKAGSTISFPYDLGFFLKLLKLNNISNFHFSAAWAEPADRHLESGKDRWLTQEGRGGDGAVAPGHHDADARLHKGHGEVHDLGALLVDGEGANGHVCALVVHLGKGQMVSRWADGQAEGRRPPSPGISSSPAFPTLTFVFFFQKKIF